MELMRLGFWHGKSSAQYARHLCGLSRENIVSRFLTIKVDVALFPFRRWWMILCFLQFTVIPGARKELTTKVNRKKHFFKISTSELSLNFHLWSWEHYIDDDLEIANQPRTVNLQQHNLQFTTCEIKTRCEISTLKGKCRIKMWHVLDCFSRCVSLPLRWEAIPLHSVRGLLHPEGKPASPHQTALRGEAFQMPHVQLRLPSAWRSERAPAHPFWYQPATHSFIHSHVKLICTDTVCTCVQCHVGWFLTPLCWFLTPFESEHEVCWACMTFPVTPCHALSYGYTHHIWHLTHLPLET